MGFFEFFFPEQAQAEHLRSIAEQHRRRTGSERPVAVKEAARIQALEQDVGFMALLLGAILDHLDRKGVVTRADLKQAVAELDTIDGVRNGRLDVNILCGRLG